MEKLQSSSQQKSTSRGVQSARVFRHTQNQQFNPRRHSAAATPQALRGVPDSYMAHPNSVFTQQSFGAAEAHRKNPHKRLLVGLLAAILITILGVAGALFWQQSQKDSPQRLTQAAIESGFAVTSFQRTAVVEGTTLIYTASYDISNPAAFKTSVDDLQLSSGTTVSLRFIDSRVYARQHFSDEVLKQSGDQRSKLDALQDVWVLWAQDGRIDQTSYPASVQLPQELLTIDDLLPSAVIMYNVPQDKRAGISDFVEKNATYTAGSEQPLTEQVNGQESYRISVAVSKAQVDELNRQVMESVGQQYASDFSATLPESVDIWVRTSDSQLVQYAYAVAEGRQVVSFDKINQPVLVEAPTVGQRQASADASVSDAAVINAVNNLGAALEAVGQLNNPYPGNQEELKGLVFTGLSEDIRNSFNFVYGTELPTQPNQIVYSKFARCDANDKIFYTEQASEFNYAIVARVSSGTICSDNVD